MDFNPLSREPKGKIPEYQSRQEKIVAMNEPGYVSDQEETIEALMKGAAIVIEKDALFTAYVQSLLNKYGSSANIVPEENVENRFGRQGEMVIAVARILEKKH